MLALIQCNNIYYPASKKGMGVTASSLFIKEVFEKLFKKLTTLHEGPFKDMMNTLNTHKMNHEKKIIPCPCEKQYNPLI